MIQAMAVAVCLAGQGSQPALKRYDELPEWKRAHEIVSKSEFVRITATQTLLLEASAFRAMAQIAGGYTGPSRVDILVSMKGKVRIDEYEKLPTIRKSADRGKPPQEPPKFKLKSSQSQGGGYLWDALRPIFHPNDSQGLDESTVIRVAKKVIAIGKGLESQEPLQGLIFFWYSIDAGGMSTYWFDAKSGLPKEIESESLGPMAPSLIWRWSLQFDLAPKVTEKNFEVKPPTDK